MGATVTRQDGTVRTITNLGWLLRHWAEIKSLAFVYEPDSAATTDGTLVGYMKDGSVYRTDYASLAVFWTWVRRQNFFGLELAVVTHLGARRQVYIIGDAPFMDLYRLALSGKKEDYEKFMDNWR